ncbi:MAG TPA: DUF6629 family protein [Chthoniobacterales bacterium]|jgi:hypothetical protein|nr:DUF6629 family protein [Chthoniobacterales bacterium]
MCFSATANFVGSGVLGAIGVATLCEVKHRRELLFAAVPTLFALHQFTEGFVWLGLDGILPAPAARDAGAAFVLYAQGLLPFLLPLSVLLIEPTRERRRRMLWFAILGAGLALFILWGLIVAPLQVFLKAHSIVYLNAYTTSVAVAVLYVIATCGALLFSGYTYLVVLGVLNVVGLVAVMLWKAYAFTSLWCAYAAVISVIIYFFFRHTREQRPESYAIA